MADFTFDKQLVSAAASSSADFEDACSICLEPFNTDEPATVTSCKHEYHLQCILEWSQRSKECPICWQLLALKDPASQELLAAVESERLLRSRNRYSAPTAMPQYQDLYHEHEGSNSDDSDFDEDIMQRLAAAASRACHLQRERQQSFGLDSTQVVGHTSSTIVPSSMQQNETNSSDEGSSPRSFTPYVPVPRPQPVVADNSEVPFKPRVLYHHTAPESPHTPSLLDMPSLSNSIKSKWSATSARYKESITKGTRGIKEKLVAHNNSVKELSKGVQREVNAGIAGVTRMIEHLDLSSKRTGSAVSSFADGPSVFSSRGKGVQDNE